MANQNKSDRLLLVEWEGKWLIQHQLRVADSDLPELDAHATDSLIPLLGKTLTRGGQVTAAAYLVPALGVPGRFRVFVTVPSVEFHHSVVSCDLL